MINYNRFHLKNRKVQTKVIGKNDYTYQTLIGLAKKYFISHGNILDMGCGVGTIDFFLGEIGHSVVGVDVSNRAIQLAKHSKKTMKSSRVNFICSSVESYSTKNTFDYAICSEVLEHVEHPERIIHKIYSLVKIGGICIFSVPSSNAPLYKWGKLQNFDSNVGHLRRYDLTSLRKSLIKPGFMILEEKKVEGLIRNSMYTNNKLGFLVRFIRYPITYFVNILDFISLRLFGESNLYIVVKKT